MTRILLALAALLAAALPAAATASFPGANGDLVVSQDVRGELSSDLFTLPWRGGRLHRITRAGRLGSGGQGTAFVGGPDAAPRGGGLLAFTNTNATGIATLTPAGELTEAPNPQGAVYDELAASPAPSWAPGGRSYATVSEAGVFEVFLDGRPARRVIAPDDRILDARWSPTGEHLAVERAGAGLWLYDARTGDRVRRLARRGMDADWSPDGRRLVYRTDYEHQEEGGATGGNLFVVRRDGTHRRSLVHRERLAETHPTWSPDGKRIAFVELGFTAGDVGFDVRPSVWTVRAAGGAPARVTRLREPYVEEGFFHAPELTWLTRAP